MTGAPGASGGSVGSGSQAPEGPSAFHPGEIELQERVGVRERMQNREGVIRDHLLDQHRAFFPLLPVVPVAGIGQDGWPVATMLAGRPGFMRSPDPRSLRIDALPDPADPAGEAIRIGAPLGLLGIDLATRRRNRLSGRVETTDASGFAVAVGQSYGNCPQYIQARRYAFSRSPGSAQTGSTESFSNLDDEARRLISMTDAFFVASSALGKETGADQSCARYGVDISHRGGRPGFVRVESDVLTIPDYSGNFFFNTLGNFMLNPQAGLLFVDFTAGDLLYVAGEVEIVWHGQDLTSFQAAERLWRVNINHGWRRRGALPLRWTFDEYAPTTLVTGTWREAEATLAAERIRHEYRPYSILRVQDEADGVRSYYLRPPDAAGRPSFLPGQFLPVRVRVDETSPLLTRNYSLTSAPGDRFLRITVKRQGVVSRYIHDHLHVGDQIEAAGPRGTFTFLGSSARPAVLISAGIGITPMVGMLRHAVSEGVRSRHPRPVVFIHCGRRPEERPFNAELARLASAGRGAVALHFFDSGEPAASPDGEQGGVGGPVQRGRLTIDRLQGLLRSEAYDFYICGPHGFTQALYDGLHALDIPDERIQTGGVRPLGGEAVTRPCGGQELGRA
jgi:ferredoxin-NADP reductase/predicted pyridoxine 5'-phosphate oxidase superfamily flavin-nucleotide-binding protein